MTEETNMPALVKEHRIRQVDISQEPYVPDVKQVLDEWRVYQQLTKDLLDDTDYQKKGDRLYKKKSAWRKYAKAFRISTRILEKEIIKDDIGRVIEATFLVEAEAPDGRTEEGWGNASEFERRFSKPNHDIPSTAHTRAKNRAISDLIGAGEVSADEIDIGRERIAGRTSGQVKNNIGLTNAVNDVIEEATNEAKKKAGKNKTQEKGKKEEEQKGEKESRPVKKEKTAQDTIDKTRETFKKADNEKITKQIKEEKPEIKKKTGYDIPIEESEEEANKKAIEKMEKEIKADKQGEHNRIPMTEPDAYEGMDKQEVQKRNPEEVIRGIITDIEFDKKIVTERNISKRLMEMRKAKWIDAKKYTASRNYMRSLKLGEEKDDEGE